jgi:hypothetical protein
LELRDRAIAALLDVHSRKLLGDGGSHGCRLPGAARAMGRGALIWSRSWSAAQRWLRTRLMHAYFQTKRPDALLALLAAMMALLRTIVGTKTPPASLPQAAWKISFTSKRWRIIGSDQPP